MTPQDLTVAVLLVTFGSALIKALVVLFRALKDRKVSKAEGVEIKGAFEAVIDVLRSDPPKEEE